jgi:hypothetical protein
MIITTLDNKEMRWQMKRGRSKKSSSLHLEALKLVQKIYPSEILIEEITIPLTYVKKVYGDIFITRVNKLIEIHGEQHYEFNPFFYSSIAEFLRAQKRDRDKKEWCDLNDIIYVELPFDKIDEWEDRINGD